MDPHCLSILSNQNTLGLGSMRLEYQSHRPLCYSLSEALQHTEAEVVLASSGHTDLSTGPIVFYATADRIYSGSAGTSRY